MRPRLRRGAVATDHEMTNDPLPPRPHTGATGGGGVPQAIAAGQCWLPASGEAECRHHEEVEQRENAEAPGSAAIDTEVRSSASRKRGPRSSTPSGAAAAVHSSCR